MAGLGVFEEGRGGLRIRRCFVARLYFFSTFVSSGILCETVSGPRLTRVDVTVMNKDNVSRYLQSSEIIKAAENSRG